MSEKTPLTNNPGFAGETGEFSELSEADVRGSDYFGGRPLAGAPGGGVAGYPYQTSVRDPDAALFEGAYAERLEKLLARYPNKQGALLPVLNLAQEVRGYLSPESMARVAEILELEPAYVRGVATFYTMYNKRPVGRYLIQVCTNVACNLCGGDDVFEAFLEHTGTEVGEISEDGLFTTIDAECLGACGFPTVVQVNDRYFEDVSAADVPALLDRLRAEAAAQPDSAADAPEARRAAARALDENVGVPGAAGQTSGQTPAPRPGRVAGDVEPRGSDAGPETEPHSENTGEQS